jgi:hypothetical protein
MTPRTMQRAAFQEDSCPNPRPVVHRILLDIEDQALLHEMKIRRDTGSGSLPLV